MVLMPGASLAVVFLALSGVLSFMLFGAGPAAIAQITPGPMRGQLTALYTSILNLLGAGLGPVAVGVLTDYVLGDPKAIKLSMLLVFLVAGIVAALFPKRLPLLSGHAEERRRLVPRSGPGAKRGSRERGDSLILFEKEIVMFEV